MLETAAKVCAVLFVITVISEQCYSLEIQYQHEVNNYLHSDGNLSPPETDIENFNEENVSEIPKQPEYDFLKRFFGENLYRDENDAQNNEIGDGPRSHETAGVVRSRMVRQTYPGQAPLYPKLPTPYNPSMNYSRPGYGVSNFYPSAQQNSTYGHHPNTPSQPQYPSYNNGDQKPLPSSPPYNPYQSNYNNSNPQWQPTSYNYSQPSYPSNGISNFYPSAQQNSTYGYHPNNPSQPQYPSYNNGGQKPINGQYAYNNYNSSSPSYPGYRPPNSTIYNSGSSQPSYNQHGQFNNNTYPSQRPQFSPTTPGNRHPVIYNNSSNRSPYNNWSANNLNHTSGLNTGPYNAPNGQNPRYFNSYPINPYNQLNSSYPQNVPTQGPHQNPSNGNNHGIAFVKPDYPSYNNNNGSSWPGHHTNVQGGATPYTPPYGQNPQNVNSYRQGPGQNPYQNPSYNQYPGSPSNSHGSDTFNLANRYNPIPNRPPYGSGPGQNQLRYSPGSNGPAHDPTKVSPEYFSIPY